MMIQKSRLTNNLHYDRLYQQMCHPGEIITVICLIEECNKMNDCIGILPELGRLFHSTSAPLSYIVACTRRQYFILLKISVVKRLFTHSTVLRFNIYFEDFLPVVIESSRTKQTV